MGLPAKKIVPGLEKRLDEVSLSLDGKKILFVFENGEGYAVPRERLPGDDGSTVVAIQIADHRHAVAVSQASGEGYDLPWDSIKHYAVGGRQRKIPLGKKLRQLRGQSVMSQSALAREAGLSRMQLSRLEKGESTPSLTTLLNLSHVLGVSPQDILQD